MTTTIKLSPAGRGESRWWGLITGALEQQAYDLPPEVVHAVEVREALQRATLAVVPEPTPLAERMYFAARAGSPIPGTDLDSLDAVATDLARLAARQPIAQAINDARERAGQAVGSAIRHNADEALALLQAAHREVLNEAMACVEKIGTHGLEDIWPDEAPIEVRRARGKLKPVAVRYASVVRARGQLAQFLERPRYDLDNEFGEMENRAAIFTPNWANKTPAPWDTVANPDARIYVMLSMGAELWCPSPAEQDEAYAQAHPTSTRLTGGPAFVITGD